MAVTDGREYGHIDIKVGENAVRHPFKDAVARESISDLSDTVEAHFPDADKLVAGTGSATGDFSSAIGAETTASHRSQHVFGEYNIADNSAAEASERGTYVEIVGNGAAGENDGEPTYSNARTLDWQGNETLAGDLTVNAGSENETSIGDIIDRVDALEEGTSGVGQHFPDTGKFVAGSGTATGDYASAIGYSTVANHKAQHVFGEYNITDTSNAQSSERGTYVEIVGNGTSDAERGNARTLDWSGNETLAGNLAVGGSVTLGGTETIDAAGLAGLKNDKVDKSAFDALKGRVDTITDTTIPGINTQIGNTGTDLMIYDNRLYLTHNNTQIGTGVEFSAGVGFDSGYIDDGRKLHLTMEGNDVAGFTPFVVPDSVVRVAYENNYLHFYDKNNADVYTPVYVQGGSGIKTYTVAIRNGLTTNRITVASNQERVILPFTYIEYFGDEIETQDGLLTVRYKPATASDSSFVNYMTNERIPCDVRYDLDVASLLNEGEATTIQIICSNGRIGDDLSSKTFEYTVTSLAISISSTFNDTSTYTGNFGLPYTCIGEGVEKTVYCYIDDEEYKHENIGTLHNQPKTMMIDLVKNYQYGAHTMKLWFETNDGAKSNVLTFSVIYDNQTSTAPIIAAYLVDDVIENGEQLKVRYVCYTPGRENTEDLRIRVYAIEDGHQKEYYNMLSDSVQNNIADTLPLSDYPSIGTGFVELSCGTTVVTLRFEVTEISTQYDVTQIDTDLVYAYKPSGYTNNSAGRETYVYNYTDAQSNDRRIYTRLRDFNWVTDGYIDGDALTLNGDARMSIELPIFSTSFKNADNETVVLDPASGATVTSKGRTIEFEFELDNVTDQNDVVFSCMNEHGVGFAITPQVCYLLSDGQTAEFDDTGFILNEDAIPCAYIKDEKRVRVSFVIQPRRYIDGTATGEEGMQFFVSCANVYINGEYANSFLYNEGARYESDAIITIGSSKCTTKLYDVMIYSSGLTRSQVLQNYKNSAMDIRHRIEQNEYNDVLDGNGNVDYNKAKYKYPCLLLIGHLPDYKKDDKDPIGAILTKPNDSGGYTTEFSMLDQKDGNFVSGIKVQGTTSQRYIRKNYKVYLAENNPSNPNKPKKIPYVLKGYDKNGNPLSIGESTLCYKIDYMSTDHANTFNANIADTLFNDSISDEPLVQNTIYGFRCLLFNLSLANHTRYGNDFDVYPNGAIEFAGDGCLNNDKSNTASFGLSSEGDSGANTKQQKWEFKDNSQLPCKFQSDQLMKKIYYVDSTDGLTKWRRSARDALESCYPDEGDLDDDGIEPKYDYLQTLFTWVCQRANFWNASTSARTYTYTYVDDGGQTVTERYNNEREYRKAIFKREFPLHFNMEHALVYYLFVEWVALSDNRAKNMFLSCKDVTAEHIVFTDSSANTIWDIVDDETGAVDESKIDWDNSTFGVWYCDLYDLDSCFGVENSGYLQIPYYADWNYHVGNSYLFNGYDSVLWCMFEEAMAAEIKRRAQRLTRPGTGEGVLNHTTLRQVHITENAELVCPAVVNHDMEYKYDDAWTKGYFNYGDPNSTPENPVWTRTHQYKYLQRGSRTEQKESFIYRRSILLYSKYQCDQFMNDQITIRCSGNVPVGTEIVLSPVQTMYLGIQFGDSGSTFMSDKVNAGDEYTFTSTPMGMSDSIYVRGASNLTSISSFAGFRPYELIVSNAVKLKTIIVGSDESGYVNDRLSGFDVSHNRLLDTLNLQNCTKLPSAFSLKSNPLIRIVRAKGSSIKEFEFADSGILEVLELGSPNKIKLLNQSRLESLTYDSLEQLTCLHIENTPNTGMLNILQQTLPNLRNGIRLINIDETIVNPRDELFMMLLSADAQGKRLDASGNLVNDSTAWPEITGVIHCDIISTAVKSEMTKKYPKLVIDNADSRIEFVVTFVNDDGITPIKDKNGNDYTQIVAQGSKPYDPVLRGDINIPEKQQDKEHYYVWTGWDNLNLETYGPRTVKAVYEEHDVSYTVRWFRTEGDTVPLNTTHATYGEDVLFDPGDKNAFPEWTSGESNRMFRVFSGWDKSTGFITGDTDVYAQWDSFLLVDGNEEAMKQTIQNNGGNITTEMSVPQIYAIAKSHKADQYWTDFNYLDITVGKDYDFSNIESEVIAENMFCDGSNTLVTDIRLFDESVPSFTLAIDYEFVDVVNESTLVSCFDPDGLEGFRLRYRGGPNIQWGDSGSSGVGVNIGYNGMRGIVVLRHHYGDKTLYVYSDKPRSSSSPSYSADVYATTATRSNVTATDAYLTIGDMSYVTVSEDEALPRGWVHWCKIWYGDLGDTTAKLIANWPHETWRMHYYGANRYNVVDNDVVSEDTCGASFIADALLPLGYTFDTYDAEDPEIKGNIGGWEKSRMRDLTNGRCFDALPTVWQSAICTVAVPSLYGGGNTYKVVYGHDKLYIPAAVEISDTNSTYQNGSYASEGTHISWASGNQTRMKFPGIILAGMPSTVNHTYYSADGDPAYLDSDIVPGTVWRNTGTSNAYVYIDEDTISKHRYIGGVSVYNANNIISTGVSGGRWLIGTSWRTRTPFASGNSSWVYVIDTGSMYSGSSNGQSNILLCFSI